MPSSSANSMIALRAASGEGILTFSEITANALDQALNIMMDADAVTSDPPMKVLIYAVSDGCEGHSDSLITINIRVTTVQNVIAYANDILRHYQEDTTS